MNFQARAISWAIGILIAGSGAPLGAQNHRLSEGQTLLGELGCVQCHIDPKISSSLRERTPDLSSAGLRYNPAYLFDYLQNPVKVRRHLGRARMPDFRFSEKEALALTAFLEQQREASGRWPDLPNEIRAHLDDPSRAISQTEFQNEVANGLICFTCHTLDGKGGAQGVELGHISYRLQRRWMKIYLVAPAMFGVPPTTMPPQFYQLAPDGKEFRELIPGAARKIQVLADYLFSLNNEKRRTLEEKFRAAKQSFPEANAALGEKIFHSQNCAACHRHDSIQPRLTNAAPDLAREAIRVNRDWLLGYLQHPVAVRPFGYRPGDGSRMPDFRLAADEVAQLSTVLHSNAPQTSFRPRTLSAFAGRKAETLLSEKLSCLGCHRLGGKGGRIGPDLTAARARLQPEYVYQMIKDPRTINPHTIMPKIPMPEEQIELIAHFLIQQPERPREDNYLPLTDDGLIPDLLALSPSPLNGVRGAIVASLANPRSSYSIYCAPCHGNEGRGNGFNAQFLTARPTIHADAKFMATRPDDNLYDAIHSGGYIMNKSQFMPPWGESLSSAEIRSLVDYMRALCQCQEPRWARDNSQRL